MTLCLNPFDNLERAMGDNAQKQEIGQVLKKQPCYGRLRPDERELLIQKETVCVYRLCSHC